MISLYYFFNYNIFINDIFCLIIATTASVGSSENGNSIPTQWIIVTVFVVVLVIVFFAVLFVRFRQRKTKEGAGEFIFAYNKSEC